MAKTPKTETAENKVYALSTWPGFLQTEVREVTKQTIIEGNVFTEEGIVKVCSQFGHESPAEFGSTVLYFVCHGKVHTRYWKRSFSTRHLRTLAHRFAKEVATRVQQPKNKT